MGAPPGFVIQLVDESGNVARAARREVRGGGGDPRLVHTSRCEQVRASLVRSGEEDRAGSHLPTLSVASGSEVDGPWLVPARAALPSSSGGGRRPPPPPAELGRVREWKLTLADLLDGDEDAIWAVPVALVGRAGTDEAITASRCVSPTAPAHTLQL